ncbi:hypothetical protein Tbis_3259 [Thermobispora bispora DSM 43833]|jgi:hypothetical protein|uniref:Uncharacterized protein n=1 Tax=Thermobispora bispora (strain ATCC 19993 / DSM 43833 / CBS 139.67 / JCM 10125 / KCTC 9307 / NBRC 14880 / R51) TaxID=469371 RepID=D6Y8Y7_THEBD|nr:hypothetical protein Tbis_3259 [Thermobispora bispora DSM 43833]
MPKGFLGELVLWMIPVVILVAVALMVAAPA